MHQSHGEKLCIHVGSFRNCVFYASISMPYASISEPMQNLCRTQSYAEIMHSLCRTQSYAELMHNLCRTESYAELMQNSILCKTYAELRQDSMLCRVCLQSMSENMPNPPYTNTHVDLQLTSTNAVYINTLEKKSNKQNEQSFCIELLMSKGTSSPKQVLPAWCDRHGQKNCDW